MSGILPRTNWPGEIERGIFWVNTFWKYLYFGKLAFQELILGFMEINFLVIKYGDTSIDL
jgi:hypothetical protein